MAEYPWSPAPGGGTQCDKHGGASFRPEHGAYCPHCLSQPVGTEVPEPGEGERSLLEAAERGLPDGYEVERRLWKLYSLSMKRSRQCTQLADDEDSDVEIRAKYEQAAAKWADTAIKAVKLGAVNVSLRERRAAKEKRDRLLAQLKGKGGN